MHINIIHNYKKFIHVFFQVILLAKHLQKYFNQINANCFLVNTNFNHNFNPYFNTINHNNNDFIGPIFFHLQPLLSLEHVLKALVVRLCS